MSVEQKRAFNKLKHDLEPWRNLIVHLDSVLTWEKNLYPAIITAVISVFYLVLWALDLSTVTTLSLGGLFVLALDFLYPWVSRFLFSPDNWSGNQEEQFERVCNQLCSIKLTLGGWYEYLFTAKERKSTLFVTIMGISLLCLAWIGSVINNLLLMYLVTMTLVMYPGIQEKSVFNKIKQSFGCAVNSKLQQLREKSKKSE